MRLTVCLAVFCSLYVAATSAYWSPEPHTYTCCASGDPHYHTFDGEWIHFQGTCKYLLAGTCPCTALDPFHVYVDNDPHPSNPSVSITRMVEIHIGGHIIVFSASAPHVTIDGNVEPLPYTIPGVGVVSNPTTNHYVFISDSGIVVTYSCHHRACVTVPCKYRGEMCGICGNMNDDVSDDLTTSGNVDTTGMDNSYNLIGNSWQVAGGGRECYQLADNEVLDDYRPPTPKQPGNCAALLGEINSPILECVRKFPEMAREYYNLCLYDVGASGDAQALCDIVEAFIDFCRRNSVPARTAPVASGWREFFNCPMECPRTMVYSESVPACPLLCPSAITLSSRIDCDEFLGEGCACPTGWYLQNGICVQECLRREVISEAVIRT